MTLGILAVVTYLAVGVAYARWGPTDFDEYEAPNALACVTVLMGPFVAPFYILGQLVRFVRRAGE
ncbi:hypothetical protein ACWDX6_24045 [Streptomyces sp. NPDC003027]